MRLMNNRKFVGFLFLCYSMIMLWLLFIRSRNAVCVDYWAQVAGRVNLIPFSSIGSMLDTLRRYPRWDVLSVVVYNLGGNIAMFVPLGFFLPALWPRFRRFLWCIAGVIGIMTIVELIQLFTLRGFCETDDVILNVTGGAIGYGIWFLGQKYVKKSERQ